MYALPLCLSTKGAPRGVDSLVAFDCRVTPSERWNRIRRRHRRPNMRPATRKADNLPP
jgi:hypothetical protein